MGTDTSAKSDKAEETGAAPEDAPKEAPTDGKEQTPATAKDTAPTAETPAADDADEGTEAAGAPPVAVRERGGFAAGAAAVVSAGLGLVSLTGNSFGEMLRERKQLIGQIESSNPTGGGGNQIDSLYGAPWHQTAVVNGIFAFLAVVIGGVLLAAVAKKAETGSWVKSVALGGVIVGLIGLVIAGGMYFDFLAAPPSLPGA